MTLPEPRQPARHRTDRRPEQGFLPELRSITSMAGSLASADAAVEIGKQAPDEIEPAFMAWQLVQAQANQQPLFYKFYTCV
jgi:hypothetical protein